MLSEAIAEDAAAIDAPSSCLRLMLVDRESACMTSILIAMRVVVIRYFIIITMPLFSLFL